MPRAETIEPPVIRGRGAPLVLVPGVQGRWEWMGPAVAALSSRLRVITYSLAGELNGGGLLETPFDVFVDELDRVFSEAGVEQAGLCGVSFGGWIALRYAAVRPQRVSRLVLVNAPGPSWRPACHLQRYLDRPRLSAPVFLAGAIGRASREIAAALPPLGARLQFSLRHGLRVLAAPLHPGRMAIRTRLALAHDFGGDCPHVRAPTLLVTGEDHLDRVVPPSSTREYLDRLRDVRMSVLPRTGHLGLVTQPTAFARLVAEFVAAAPVAEARASAESPARSTDLGATRRAEAAP